MGAVQARLIQSVSFTLIFFITSTTLILLLLEIVRTEGASFLSAWKTMHQCHAHGQLVQGWCVCVCVCVCKADNNNIIRLSVY